MLDVRSFARCPDQKFSSCGPAVLLLTRDKPSFTDSKRHKGGGGNEVCVGEARPGLSIYQELSVTGAGVQQYTGGMADYGYYLIPFIETDHFLVKRFVGYECVHGELSAGTAEGAGKRSADQQAADLRQTLSHRIFSYG